MPKINREIRQKVKAVVSTLYNANASFSEIQKAIQRDFNIYITTNSFPWILEDGVPLKHERRYIIADSVIAWREEGLTYQAILRKVKQTFGFTISRRVVSELIRDLPPQGRVEVDMKGPSSP